MHIGIDIRSLASPIKTGVGEYTFELLNALFTIDHTNHYYLFASGRKKILTHLPEWKQPNVHYCPFPYSNKLLKLSTKLAGWPKLDHTITKQAGLPTGLDYFFSPSINFTALSKKTPHIVMIHDLTFEFFPHFFSAKQRLWHLGSSPKKTCQTAKKIIVPSENTKRDLVDHYQLDPNKINVIYHGYSTLFDGEKNTSEKEQVQKKYDLPERFILFLGTIEPRKNILALIEGFETAARRLDPAIHLVIAGSPGWKNKPVFKRIAQSPFKERITHIGYIDTEDKPGLYQAAEIFAYPSYYEGFGFPIIEAMASGTPVITSNRSSLPEIAGSAAYFINPNKPHTIAEGLCRIVNDQELKNRLITDGYEQVKKFTWMKAAEAWLKMLD